MCDELSGETGNVYLLSFIYIYIFMATLGLCSFTWAFSSRGEQGLLSSCCVQASYCSGFSCCRAWALGVRASVTLPLSLGNCGPQA